MERIREAEAVLFGESLKGLDWGNGFVGFLWVAYTYGLELINYEVVDPHVQN